MEGIQGYFKGMDQDSAYNKRDKNSYFELHNYRVVTDEGSSSGSLVNEKGTKKAFSVPNLAAMTLTNGTIIPAQSNLQIIGSCTMVDEIIIFTTNSTSATPTGYGQIWKCKFDESTGEIIGLTPTGFLDPTIHLFYNQQLKFSTEYRIGRAVALYETKDKQRVYWTDNYNPVRTFNLAATNPLDTPLAIIDIFSGVNLAQPVFESYGSGNLPTPRQVQFTYRQLTTGGSSTAYAPPTPMIPLPYTTVSANTFSTWTGGGSANNKSVTYSITGLDTNYDVIEHVAIIYDEAGAATIWKFAEDSVPTTGELTVICTDLSNATSIPLEEYSFIDSGFDRCKDIEVQGNRLIAANISTDKTEFDFEARAFRFNDPATKYSPATPNYPLATSPVGPTCLLKDSSSSANDVVLFGGVNTPLWTSVPEEHDCINLFNQEMESNWFDPAQQYKYQADGVTLGGEGPNIKYEFITKAMVGNNVFDEVTNAPNHIQVPSFQINDPSLYKGTLEIDGTPQPVHVQNQIANMAGPWAHSEFNGYARGEVYRFGIVFYSKKGVPTFVKWIGDIKFPDVHDGFPLQTFVNDEAVLQQLGIRFSVDVSSIADKISGYSIVRLERKDIDKTKLGTGFHMYFDVQSSSAATSLMHRYFLTGLGLGSGAPNDDPFPVTGSYQYYGDDDANFMHLSDRPGETNLVRSNDVYYRIGYLISPFGSIYTSPWTGNDYLETLEYYRAELHKYYEHPDGTGSFGTDADFAFYYKMNQRAAPLHNLERIQIQKSKDMYAGEIIKTSSEYLDDLDTGSSPNLADCGNASYCRDKALLVSGAKELYPLGVGSPRRLLRLHTEALVPTGATDLSPTIPHMSYGIPKYQNVATGGSSDADIFWFGPDYPGNSITINFGGTSKSMSDVTFKSVGYRRYLPIQYKGNTYESRSTNEYMFIGHFQSTLPAAALNLTTDIFGGDTYVNYYDEEMLERYNNEVQNPLEIFKPSNVNKLGVAVCGPVESAVNTNWRTGRNWAKDRNADDMDAYSQNSVQISPVWNQEDEVQREFFAEDFLAQFVEEHPFQLWASKVKINGELEDNWRNFPLANKTEVDGIHGPINRILSFKDNLLFYQDKAFGIASLDERSVIQDDSGQELVLGSGGVFPAYKYISTNTGTVHQFSVVETEGSVYHYDARLKKIMRFAGGPQSISDMKGMSSWLAKNITGAITATDKTLRDSYPVGVHGEYDQRYNRVLYTFLVDEDTSVNSSKPLSAFQTEDGGWFFPANTFVTVGGSTYFVTIDVIIPATNPPTSPNLDNIKGIKKRSLAFTLSFNEMLNTFESFYDFFPGMYLEYGRRLMSVADNASNELHTHNEGNYGEYYGRLVKSRLHTIFSDPGHINKIHNNIAYNDEMYDTNDVDIYDETLNTARFYNNYQDTDTYDLVVGNNIKRRMRTWRVQIPREKDKLLSRMRNPWLECVLEFKNNGNKRHVLHEIIYSYMPTKM